VSIVLIDTSAMLALLSATDQAHRAAVEKFQLLSDEQAQLVTTSYVLVETYALIDRRLGREALTSFRARFAPLLNVIWVDADLHEAGLDLLGERSTGLSLVDAVSFAAARAHHITRAFAFDQDFDAEGLTLD
jgi:predicted nucleic acid-binding protein